VPAGTASEVSEDAAEVATARQLVTALLDLQQDSAATASDGATAVAAVVVPANAASAGVNVLQEEEHLVNPEFSNDSAATSGPAVASVESAEQEYAAEEITQQEGEQQAETSHDEESEGVAEAADADAPGQATSEEAAEMLQQISSSIAPALARYAQLLLPGCVIVQHRRVCRAADVVIGVPDSWCPAWPPQSFITSGTLIGGSRLVCIAVLCCPAT
jgi:hypothetical protein